MILVANTAIGPVRYYHPNDTNPQASWECLPRQFLYQWRFVPTGNTGTRMVAVANVTHFVALLALWNRQQPGVWEHVPLTP